MKIAIHDSPGTFSQEWINYCKERDIPFKVVNCYSNDIIHNIRNCDIIMWHFQQAFPKDMFFARDLLYSLEVSGKTIFPNHKSSWHFDNKVAQKYFFESHNIPTPKTYVFYDKHELFEWSKQIKYPIVFKLKSGAGSRNVRLIKNRNQLKRLGNMAFGRGIRQYNAIGGIKEAIRKYGMRKCSLTDLAKAFAHLWYPVLIERLNGREWGYFYLQEYIPTDCDYRVVVIKDKAFAIKRLVRENDFRASGSGYIKYDKAHFNEDLISLSFDLAKRLNSDCIAFDFVYHNDKPLVLEVSYGWSKKGYYDCPGYWTNNLNWHEGGFNPYGWMIENCIKQARS